MTLRAATFALCCTAIAMNACSSKDQHIMNNPADQQGSAYVGHEVRDPLDPLNSPVVTLHEPLVAALVGMPQDFSVDASDPNPAGLGPGSITGLAWDFGDGTSVTDGARSTTHTFTETGSYTVTVRAVDNDGNQGSSSVRVPVASDAPPIAPPETWTSAPLLPTAREFAGAATIDGWLYVVGGGTRGNGILNSLEVYVAPWNFWLAGPPMSSARRSLGAVAVDGLLYAVGGHDGTRPVGTMEVFDPGPGTWTTTAPMPTPRHGMAVVEASGRIYAIGGTGGANGESPVSTVEVYYPESATWTDGAPLPSPRGQAVGASIGSRIYVVGGDTDSLHVYDLRTNAWTVGASMPASHLRVPVAAAIGGMFYVLGDYGGTGPNSVYIYDPVYDTWSEGPPLERGRWDPCGAASDGRLFVVGGSRLPCDDSIWCIFGGINAVSDFDILGP